MSDEREAHCYFCGSTENLHVREAGIAFGMAGEDYDFCGKCLKGMKADEF